MSKSNRITQKDRRRIQLKHMVKEYEKLKQKEIRQEGKGIPRTQRIFQLLNSIAMCYAREGYINKAELWLLKAETLTNDNQKHSIIFFSNMACIFKQKGQLDKSIEYLTKAEEILHKILSSSISSKKFQRMLIDCWLNMSALLSSQKKHEQSIQIIHKADSLISKNIQNGHEKFIDQFIVAKYNEAVQYEHLRKIEIAFQCIEKLKKNMYDLRIYGHFLEKKINDTYQDLRKKVYKQNLKKRTLSLAASMSKLKQDIIAESVNNSHFRKMSICNLTERQNRPEISQDHYKSVYAPVTLEPLTEKTGQRKIRFRSSSKKTLTERNPNL